MATRGQAKKAAVKESVQAAKEAATASVVKKDTPAPKTPVKKRYKTKYREDKSVTPPTKLSEADKRARVTVKVNRKDAAGNVTSTTKTVSRAGLVRRARVTGSKVVGDARRKSSNEQATKPLPDRKPRPDPKDIEDNRSQATRDFIAQYRKDVARSSKDSNSTTRGQKRGAAKNLASLKKSLKDRS